MDSSIMWSPYDETGLEHLRLVLNGRQVFADGFILRVKENEPFRAYYEIRCDADWRVQEFEVRLLNDSESRIKLIADGKGHWTDGSGNSFGLLEGCHDVDISVTPFTNTLAIRRMQLKPGESSEIEVAYIAVPEMEITRSRQRYTCLEINPDGGLYRYADEGLFRGFAADLRVDSQGLVLDYPKLFRRVWSAASRTDANSLKRKGHRARLNGNFQAERLNGSVAVLQCP